MAAFDIYRYVTGTKGLLPGDVIVLPYKAGRKATKYRPAGKHLGLAPNETLVKVPTTITATFAATITVIWQGPKVAPAVRVDLQFETVDGPIGADGYELAHANGDNLDFLPTAPPVFDEPVIINLGPPPPPPPLVPTTALQIIGNTGNPAAIELTAFNNTTVLWGRSAGGTAAAPTALPINAFLFGLNVAGYTPGGWSGATGQLSFRTSESYTALAQGTEIFFSNTANGTAVLREIWKFSAAGHLLPLAANAFDLGSAAVPVRTGFFGTGVRVDQSNLGPPALDAGTLFYGAGVAGGAARMEWYGFGTPPSWFARFANGTPSVPMPPGAGQALLNVGAGGYGATGWATGARAQVQFVTAQVWTDTAQGAELFLNTTPNGSTVLTSRWKVAHDGHFLPGAANAYDIGAVGFEVRTGWFVTLGAVNGNFTNLVTTPVVNLNRYGAAPAIQSFTGGGTSAAPTPSLAFDPLFLMQFFGRAPSGTSTGAARITAQAAENFTDTAQGVGLYFSTTPIGTKAQQDQWIIQHDGHFVPLRVGLLDIGAPTLPLRSGYYNTSLIISNAGANTPPVIDVNSCVQFTRNSGHVRLELNGHGGPNLIEGRRANGTAAARTNVKLNDSLLTLSGGGYGATAYGSGRAVIVMQAAQDWTDTAQGAGIFFQTTPIGAAAIANRWTIQSDGHFSPALPDTYDFGSGVSLVRNLYLSRNILFGPATAASVALRPQPGPLLDVVLGDASNFADLRARTVGTTQAFTVATLPAATAFGQRAMVTDANSAVFNAVVAGGGANKVPVFSDGAAWRIG